MNRKLATGLIIVVLGALFFLRESPIAILVVTAITAIVGMVGVTIRVERPRRWTIALAAFGIGWFALRCVIDSELRSLFVGEALLFCIAAECLRIRDWTARSTTIPALAVVSLICAMQQRIAFEMLGVYTFLGICVVLAVGWFSTENRPNASKQFFRKRASVAVAVLGVAGFASFKISEVMGEQISVLENRVETWLSQFTLDDAMSPYASSGDLASISLGRLENPNEVAVRVYSQPAPGYLTSRVFDVFDHIRWRVVSQQLRANHDHPRFDTLQPTSNPSIRVPQGESIFQMGETSDSPQFTTFEISNVSGRGPMVFFPRSTRYIRGYGRTLTADKAGVVYSGLNTDNKYYAYTDTQAPESFPFEDRAEGDKLRQQSRALHLHVPQQTRELFDPIVKEVLGGLTDVEEQRDAVVNYLTSGYRYSLTPLQDVGRKQYLNAFVDQRQGHCELFATTAAVMLRMNGTPTRYVIGYVCRDRDPDDDDYWAALNRNLHAWAEAWDAKRQRWVLVEATPGMSEVAEQQTAADGSGADEEEVVQQARGAGMNVLSDGRWYRVFQWTGLVVTCLMLTWTWYRFADRGADSGVANSAILQLDRRVAKAGLIRRTGETLHEFADRVEAHDDSSRFDPGAAAEFYRNYGTMLYSGNTDQLAELSVPATS